MVVRSMQHIHTQKQTQNNQSLKFTILEEKKTVIIAFHAGGLPKTWSCEEETSTFNKWKKDDTVHTRSKLKPPGVVERRMQKYCTILDRKIKLLLNNVIFNDSSYPHLCNVEFYHLNSK